MRIPVDGSISRRGLLRGTICVLIGSLSISLPWPTPRATPATLGALLRHRTSAERIGRRYLATLPAGTDESQLFAMSPTLDHALHAARHQPAVAADLLRKSINDDFRRADTIIVDGWVLAATEARFCAVVALA
jgi:hypothetical protein